MNVLPTSKLAPLNIKWPTQLTQSSWLEPYIGTKRWKIGGRIVNKMGKKSKDQELGTIRDYLKVHVAWTEAQLSDNE